MIGHIAIISVPVADQAAAKRFYVEAMGFDVVADDPMEGGRRWVQLVLPGAQAAITLVTWFDRMPAGSRVGTVIETPDVEAARVELIAKGAAPAEMQSAPWGRYFTLSDPDGNGWIVQQRLEAVA